MKTVNNKKKTVKKVVTKEVSPMQQLLETLPTQKSKVVYFAEEGKTIDEIVEITGIRKINVAWYYSKLGYCRKAKASKKVEIQVAKDRVKVPTKKAVQKKATIKAAIKKPIKKTMKIVEAINE